jgi:hypothetical protein
MVPSRAEPFAGADALFSSSLAFCPQPHDPIKAEANIMAKTKHVLTLFICIFCSSVDLFESKQPFLNTPVEVWRISGEVSSFFPNGSSYSCRHGYGRLD